MATASACLKIKELEQELRKSQVACEGFQSQFTAEKDKRITAEYENLQREKTIRKLLADRPAASPVDIHQDDSAVDRTAAAMKAKLAKQRGKGYGGWEDPGQCNIESLAKMLVEHIEKGDPIDIANFAMMLHNRGAHPGALTQALAEVQAQAIADAYDATMKFFTGDWFGERVSGLPVCKAGDLDQRAKDIRQANSLPDKAADSSRQPAFQDRVAPWMQACFGPEISNDTIERNHRFLEESLELIQSCGCTASEAHQLVDYVFGRPVGVPEQEAGGVMVTLAALCLANGLDMHVCGEVELIRIWGLTDSIRAKQAAKPKHSPLPQAVEAPAVKLCNYPSCNCPFDAPGDPNWCARGLPHAAPEQELQP